jgi:hypothetical protein
VRYFLQRYRRATIEEAVEAAAQAAREPLLKGTAHLCHIPVNLHEVAERMETETGALEPDAPLLGSLSLEDGRFMARTASSGTTGGQDRFTLAHELGHRLFREGLRHQVSSLSLSEKVAEDKICEMFAAALLMPIASMPPIVERLPSEGPCDILRSLEDAAKHFDVSLPALILRVGQIRARKSPSMIILCLAYFANHYTRSEVCLRVWVCSHLGRLRDVRTWYNRSARGVGLDTANDLFESWRKTVGDAGEPTGGKYTLDADGNLARVTRGTMRWVPQRLNVSVNSSGFWQKCSNQFSVASSLYARRGWQADQAYIVSLIRRPE